MTELDPIKAMFLFGEMIAARTREECALVCDARAKRENDGNWSDADWEIICEANKLAADDIRSRSMPIFGGSAK